MKTIGNKNNKNSGFKLELQILPMSRMRKNGWKSFVAGGT